MNPIGVGVVMGGVLAISTATFAADLLVPSEFPTVQAAHDAAVDGDRIVLAPGVYPAEAWSLSKAISLVSAGGPLRTTVTARTKGAAGFAFESAAPATGPGILIAGITFIGGAENGISGGSTRIERCRFVDCGGPGAFGGALQVGSFGDPELLLQDCSFERCHADGGGAIAVFRKGLHATNCIFLQNAAIWSGGASEGGAVHLIGAEGTFDRCTFAGNSAAVGGAIARWWNNPTVQVTSTRFGANSSDWNCCVSCTDCGSAVLSDFALDCNSNGVPDRIEVMLAPESDAVGDGIPDVCQCRADLVTDSTVNGADMAIVLNFWGTDGSQFPGVDIDGDGIVNGADLAAVLNAWGPCPQ
jgi:hypothetical protein